MNFGTSHGATLPLLKLAGLDTKGCQWQTLLQWRIWFPPPPRLRASTSTSTLRRRFSGGVLKFTHSCFCPIGPTAPVSTFASRTRVMAPGVSPAVGLPSPLPCGLISLPHARDKHLSHVQVETYLVTTLLAASNVVAAAFSSSPPQDQGSASFSINLGPQGRGTVLHGS